MIGKLRQQPVTVMNNAFDPRCGVLAEVVEPQWGRHVRYAAPAVLNDYVEHFWIDEWDVPEGLSQRRVMLPHPSIHLVFARHRSRVYGVQQGRFVRELRNRDRILGVKFRPGGFYAFFKQPAAGLVDAALPLTEIFDNALDVERRILDAENDLEQVAEVTKFLLAFNIRLDAKAHLVRDILEWIENDRSATRVSTVKARFLLHSRTLQRLFARHVGANARWVIRHYRMHELLKRIQDGESISWTSLAHDLGYFDQSHLINDFERLVGSSPARYANEGVTDVATSTVRPH